MSTDDIRRRSFSDYDREIVLYHGRGERRDFYQNEHMRPDGLWDVYRLSPSAIARNRGLTGITHPSAEQPWIGAWFPPEGGRAAIEERGTTAEDALRKLAAATQTRLRISPDREWREKSPNNLQLRDVDAQHVRRQPTREVTLHHGTTGDDRSLAHIEFFASPDKHWWVEHAAGMRGSAEFPPWYGGPLEPYKQGVVPGGDAWERGVNAEEVIRKLSQRYDVRFTIDRSREWHWARGKDITLGAPIGAQRVRRPARTRGLHFEAVW